MAVNHSRKRRMENVWDALKNDKIAIISIIFLAFIIILSIIAPLLPLEPNKTNVAHMLEAPSWQHIFGTDEVGRDYLCPGYLRRPRIPAGRCSGHAHERIYRRDGGHPGRLSGRYRGCHPYAFC